MSFCYALAWSLQTPVTVQTDRGPQLRSDRNLMGACSWPIRPGTGTDGPTTLGDFHRARHLFDPKGSMRVHPRGCGPGRRRALVLAVFAALSLIAPGCSAASGPVALQTYTHSVATCELLPVRGVLVADLSWGLALMGTDEAGNSHQYGVVWPYGYSARRDQTILLLDPAGNVVAREGDKVVLDAVRQDPLYPCADIQVVQN